MILMPSNTGTDNHAVCIFHSNVTSRHLTIIFDVNTEVKQYQIRVRDQYTSVRESKRKHQRFHGLNTSPSTKGGACLHVNTNSRISCIKRNGERGKLHEFSQ